MGGRGASSQSSKASRGGVGSLTDRKLTGEIDRLGKVMEETAQSHVAYLQGRGGSKADSDRYRAAQSRRSQLVNEQMRRQQAETARNTAARAANQKPVHTFVNGFGEATHRYITTDTYERAQRRLDKEIMGFLGRR